MLALVFQFTLCGVTGPFKKKHPAVCGRAELALLQSFGLDRARYEYTDKVHPRVPRVA